MLDVNKTRVKPPGMSEELSDVAVCACLCTKRTFSRLF